MEERLLNIFAAQLEEEKVFEIDTSDQMVIPSLWASSIGLHLINIPAVSSCLDGSAPHRRS